MKVTGLGFGLGLSSWVSNEGARSIWVWPRYLIDSSSFSALHRLPSAEYLVKFKHVVSKICDRTDQQTDEQTDMYITVLCSPSTRAE